MNKSVIILFIICLLGWSFTDGGTIVGTVRAKARPEVDEDVQAGKYESRKYKFIERIDYDALREFVVYIDDPALVAETTARTPVHVIIQKDGTFKPHVLPVLVGTTVQWPNHDEIFHNVFSMSEPKPFDLGIYKSNEIKKVTFDKPGRVDVFCSIHTKMSCIVLVLENPYFASTDKNGSFRINNVPAGTYPVKAWHERLPSQSRQVTVPSAGEVVVDFVLTVAGLPKY